MEDTRSRIIQAAIKGVRQYGLEGVRIQTISKLAGLSPGALYRYFESKEQLMEVCFYHVDRQVAQIYDGLSLPPQSLAANPAQAIKAMWLPYFHFWTAHPDEAIFYFRFRDSARFPAFDKQRDISYFKNFGGLVHLFMERFPRLRQLNPDILWNYVLTFSLVFAKYVIEGILPNNKDTEDNAFQLLVTGLSGYLQA